MRKDNIEGLVEINHRRQTGENSMGLVSIEVGRIMLGLGSNHELF